MINKIFDICWMLLKDISEISSEYIFLSLADKKAKWFKLSSRSLSLWIFLISVFIYFYNTQLNDKYLSIQQVS